MRSGDLRTINSFIGVLSPLLCDSEFKAAGSRTRVVDGRLVYMERHFGSAYQRYANYCHERGVDENEAVIAMTVTCHIDDLHVIEKRGRGAGSLTREPCHILQMAGILGVGMGNQPSFVNWEKVKYYLEVGEKLRK